MNMDAFLIETFPPWIILFLEFFKTIGFVAIITGLFTVFAKIPLLFTKEGRKKYIDIWADAKLSAQRERKAQKRKNTIWKNKLKKIKKQFSIPFGVQTNINYSGNSVYFTITRCMKPFSLLGRPQKNKWHHIRYQAISDDPHFRLLNITLYENSSIFEFVCSKNRFVGNIIDIPNKKALCLKWAYGGNEPNYFISILEQNDSNELIATFNNGERIHFKRLELKEHEHKEQ